MFSVSLLIPQYTRKYHIKKEARYIPSRASKSVHIMLSYHSKSQVQFTLPNICRHPQWILPLHFCVHFFFQFLISSLSHQIVLFDSTIL